MIEPKIDPEFRDKIPPIPAEDFEGLREDILRDGYIRDPLVVWDEENILLDGHHRWRVIQEHPELPYTIDRKSFPNRWAAIAWICANQLHKHNMNEMQKMKLIQEEYEARKKSWGGDRGNQYTVASEEIVHLANDEPETIFKGSPGKEQKLRPTIAKEHGISEGIVQTAVEVGRGIDRAAEVDPEFKREVLSGEVKAAKKDLAEIRKMETEEEVKTAIEKIRNPKVIINPNIPSKPRSKQTEEEKKIADRVNRIVEIQNDNNRDTSITIDDLAELVEEDGKDYVSSLRNMLVVRSTLLVGENRQVIANVLENIINEINKVKELLK